MNLSGLIYFVTVADCGSYTKAAQQLFVTQPALSRQISALEDELGKPVFIRKSKSIELTPAGEICLKEARLIIEHCNDLRSKVHQLNGELDIAYCSGMSVISDVLEVIYSQYSGIHINLSCVQPSKIPALLAEGKADLVIALDMVFKRSPDVETIPLSNEEICVFVPERHYLASRESVEINELASEKFIMGERSMGPEGVDYTVELCAKAGFRPDSLCYVNDIQSALYMVGAGQGVGIAVSYAENLNIPGVKCLHISGASLPVNIVLAHNITNHNHILPPLMNTIRKQMLVKRIKKQTAD